MTLYNLRSDGTITKWDSDGNIQAQYSVSEDGCTCPAGHRHTCRHRQMLPDLLPIVDTHYFWDYDKGITVDFNGVPRSLYTSFLDEIEREKPEVDLPAEQDTLSAEEIEALLDGLEKDHQHELQLKTTLPASYWRRI